jgi:hypothetical protein
LIEPLDLRKDLYILQVNNKNLTLKASKKKYIKIINKKKSLYNNTYNRVSKKIAKLISNRKYNIPIHIGRT